MYLKIIALLDKEVQLVLKLLQHGPLQESLSLAKSLQTLSLSEHRVHTVNTHKRTNTKMCVCVFFFSKNLKSPQDGSVRPNVPATN